MTREALIELAMKIMNDNGTTEEDDDEILTIFLENVPDPSASDYFFSKKYNDLTAEEIVDKALSYKPIQLQLIRLY